MDAEFIEQVRELDGVEKVLPVYVFENEIECQGMTFRRLEAAGQVEWYCSMLALHETSSGMKEQAVSAFADERAVLLSESWMERLGVSPGDFISLANGTMKRDYRVAGSFKSRASDAEAVIPSRYAEIDFGADRYDFLAYTAADPEAVMVQICSLFGEIPNWSRTVEEFNRDALSTVGAFLQPMHSMTYFILLLAAVGIMNNLLINYIQKRRTIAMYQSLGLSSRQNRRMALTEGFSSGLIGAVIAVCVSYMEIQTIFLVAGPKISTVPELEPGVFLAAGTMGIGITLMGSAVPIWRCRQMKLAEEIKCE